MPSKNIAASIIAIMPSFRGGVSLRICLSKSSQSRRSILRSPFCLCETRQNCRCSTDRRGTNVGFLDWGAATHSQLMRRPPIQKDKASISTGLRRAEVCQSLGAILGLSCTASHNGGSRGCLVRAALLSPDRRQTLTGSVARPRGVARPEWIAPALVSPDPGARPNSRTREEY